MRELNAAARARGRHEWSIGLMVAEFVCNKIPSFSKGGSKPLKLQSLNPYGPPGTRRRKGIPLKGDLGEKLLDTLVDKQDRNGR